MHRKRFMIAVCLLALAGCSAEQPPAGAAMAEPEETSGAEGQVQTVVEKVEPVEAEPEDPGPQPIRLSDVGLATPESIQFDAAADVYLISNVNGSPLEKNGNGFLSRISPTGEILDLKWIDGEKEGVTLNAPKGMAIHEDTLYVADIDVVRMFDRNSGEPKGEVKVAGASFLNALAIGQDGTVYVSDSGLKETKDGLASNGKDAIYRIENGKAKPLIKSKKLGGPNGMLADADGLWVVSFGSGELYRVTAKGKQEKIQKLPQGQLDGIVRTEDGRLLISSWEGNALYLGEPGGEFVLAVGDLPAPAGIGVDAKRNQVLVPLFQKNEAVVYPLALVKLPEPAVEPAGEPAAEPPPPDSAAKPAAPAPAPTASAPAAPAPAAAPQAQPAPQAKAAPEATPAATK